MIIKLYKYIFSERAFALFVLLLFACHLYGQDKIFITGTIFDVQTKSVVSDAKVTAENGGEKITAYSDMQGNFILANLVKTDYKITVTRLGYKTEVINNFSINKIDNPGLIINLSSVDIETERINVTASKIELTLKQTPSSINIVSAEEINRKNILTFDNVLQGVQGVNVFRTSGINVQSLSIRGSSDVAGGGIGNRVLLLLDGRPSLTGDSKGALWSLIPIGIIERTEVVKGAFSSLYGSSAIGGVVNIITKKPTYKPLTTVNFNYGFYQKLNDSLKFTNKLLSFKGFDITHSSTYKKLAYLLNVNYKQNDGHAQQTDYEFYGGVGKFMYDVLRNRDLEVTLQYTKSNSAFPHYWRKDPGKIAQPYQVNPVYIGDRIKKETSSIDVFYTAIPSSKMKYTSRFYYYKLSSVSVFNPNNFVAQTYGIPGQAFETYIKSYNLGNITQFDYNISKRNYLISGLDVQYNFVRSSPESILYGNQQMNNWGLFIQDNHKLITDKNNESILSTTAGVRLDFNKYVGGSQFFQVNPKLSLLWTPNTTNKVLENTSFRVLVGRAFRAPSIAELYFKKELFGGFDFVFNPNLKPEEMLSAEIGFRKQYEKRFTFDVSAYINEYNNLIQYVNIGRTISGPFQVQNIAKSQIRGIEALLDYTSSFNLFRKQFGYSFGVNYSLVDAKDLSSNRKDEFLPYKPVHNLNFTTDLSYLGFNYNVTGKYVSKVEEDLFYKYEEPKEYFILDMKLSKRLFNKLTLFIAVSNLLNESYQELERTQAPNRSFNSGVKLEF